MTVVRNPFRRFAGADAGSATVEFAIAVPLVLSLLFSAIDFGAVMLRQVFLDRSVDLAMRQVRLGAVDANGHADLRRQICAGTLLIADCENVLTIEMRPLDTTTFAGLDAPAQCVNRAQAIAPVLSFDPGAGRQELMLVRVCAVVDPFIDATGLILGMPRDASGGYHVVTLAAFANEPA